MIKFILHNLQKRNKTKSLVNILVVVYNLAVVCDNFLYTLEYINGTLFTL